MRARFINEVQNFDRDEDLRDTLNVSQLEMLKSKIKESTPWHDDFSKEGMLLYCLHNSWPKRKWDKEIEYLIQIGAKFKAKIYLN